MEIEEREREQAVSNPVKAGRHLKEAKGNILEALRALGGYRGTEPLEKLAERLGIMADEFEAGRLLGGLKTNLCDIHTGASVMGQSTSVKKLESAARARAALAAKRAALAVERRSRKKNSLT